MLGAFLCSTSLAGPGQFFFSFPFLSFPFFSWGERGAPLAKVFLFEAKSKRNKRGECVACVLHASLNGSGREEEEE